MKIPRSTFVLAIALGPMLGCGGTEVAGDWSGDWLSVNDAGGSTEMSLDQSGDSIQGQVHFTGSPCFAAGAVTAHLRDDEMDGFVEAGDIRVDFTATITDDALDGSYRAVSAGACTGDTGTFTLRRR